MDVLSIIMMHGFKDTLFTSLKPTLFFGYQEMKLTYWKKEIP